MSSCMFCTPRPCTCAPTSAYQHKGDVLSPEDAELRRKVLADRDATRPRRDTPGEETCWRPVELQGVGSVPCLLARGHAGDCALVNRQTGEVL